MNSIFDIPEWETLRIAGIGRTRTGKTTFFAANAISPVYAIDADKGYVRTRRAMIDKFPEITGEVYFPSNKGCLVPLLIHQEAERNIFDKNIKTTVIDSVTKIYGFNTRPAVMAGRMTPQQREQYGFSKNKAANLQNKADAIQVLTYLAGYGTHIFYIWHEQETVDMESVKKGKMDLIMRETMSKEERKRLFTSIDIVLRFSIDKGRYAITVDPETRGYGSVPNTGFTIYDKPGNYWRGALSRIYGLIYTTFDSKDEAIAWGQKKLAIEDSVEAEAWYEEVKTRARPETPSAMWLAWMMAVEEKFLTRQKNGQAHSTSSGQEKIVIESPKPMAVTNPSSLESQDSDYEQGPGNADAISAPEEPAAPPPPEEELSDLEAVEHAHALGVPAHSTLRQSSGQASSGQEDEVKAIVQDELPTGQFDDFDTLEQDLEQDSDKIIDEALGRLFSNGDEVLDEDYEDFQEYRKRFGRAPYDITVLHRSKEMNKDWV